MRHAWILFGALFSANIGYSVLAPVLPSLMRQMGMSELQGGLMLSVSSIAWIFCSSRWGRYSDSRGRKPVIIIGLAGYALGSGVFALVMQAGLDGVFAGVMLTWLLLVGSRLMVGALFSAAIPAAQAYVADVSTGRRRTSAMGILTSSVGMGNIFGPALGAVVVSLGLGLVAPLLLAALSPLLGVLLVWRWLPPVRPVLEQGESAPKLGMFDGRLLPFLFVGFCALLVLSMVQFTIGFLVQDRFGLDAVETTRQTGLVVMGSGVALLFTRLVLIQVFRPSPMKLLWVGMPLMLAAMLLMGFALSVAQLLLAMVLLGLGIGMVQPGFRSAITFTVEPREQGAAAGLASAMPGYGFLVGPAMGTGLYSVDPLLPFLVTALVVLGGIAVLVVHPAARALQPAT